MNVKIIMCQPLTEDMSKEESMQISDLRGFVCFIPSVNIGQPMEIMSSNMVSTRYKAGLVIRVEEEEQGRYRIATEKATFEVLNLEYGRKKPGRIKATRYMESRICHTPLRVETDPDGHLFADGVFPTKLFASDLPEHFVYGYMYKRHGYISAAGVKHLLYVPNYVFNHRHKDDTLYISYDSPIWSETDTFGIHYAGYKHAVSGWLIVDFVNAAEKYSGYDVSEIRQEIQKKSDWFDEKYGCGDKLNG